MHVARARSASSAGLSSWTSSDGERPVAQRLRQAAAPREELRRRGRSSSPRRRAGRVIRIQIGLRLKAPAMARSTSGSSSPCSRSRRTSTSPSSPSMRTNPPSGIQLRLYRVPCQTTEVIRGGKPIPNSSTVMPARLATMKWPSSWTSTRTTRMPMKAATVPMTSIRPIASRPRSRPDLGVEGRRWPRDPARHRSPQRSTASAIVSAMAGKAMRPSRKACDRDLVGGVQDRRRGCRRPRRPDARRRTRDSRASVNGANSSVPHSVGRAMSRGRRQALADA